jgi:hypothetical protein
MLKLSDRTPFSSGGNRLCFRHPEQAERCLKVLRADRTPAQRRQAKGFPANLRPLSFFDENRVELEVLEHLHQQFPDAIRRHLPQTYGMVETDLGDAHETTLMVDHDGRVSQTLEQYIWDHGLNEVATRSIAEFKQDWETQPPKTRDLIPHNMVLQDLGDRQQIMLIDGLGRKPRMNAFGTASNARYQRRVNDLDVRIQRILHRKATNTGPTERLNNLIR